MQTVWMYFAIGLIGVLLHVVKEINDKKIAESTLATYLASYKWQIVYGVLAYGALFVLWYEGSAFALLKYVGIDVEPVPLNMMTIFVGYFANSIMSAVLGAVSKLLERFGSKSS